MKLSLSQDVQKHIMNRSLTMVPGPPESLNNKKDDFLKIRKIRKLEAGTGVQIRILGRRVERSGAKRSRGKASGAPGASEAPEAHAPGIPGRDPRDPRDPPGTPGGEPRKKKKKYNCI